jgi:uncharacterized protein
MVIDFHTHVVPLRVKENRQDYAAADSGFASIFSDPKAKLATAEELIASMDKNGVDASVALNYGWRTASLCKEINDYLLDAAKRYPGRLVPFCNVDLSTGDAAIKEVERCIKLGARGIGEIRPDTQLNPGNWPDTFKPLAEILIKHNLILLTHASEPVGHLYPGKGTATPDRLYALATAFPGMTIVCAHWGGGLPFYGLMPEVKIALKNVYFDTAASLFLYTPQVYGQVAQLVGEDKILFGSDYPLIPQSRFLKEIRALDLSGETKEKILGGNAKRLLGIAQISSK